jgi:hypothetical protein
MKKTNTPPRLSLVEANANGLEPPRSLGAQGRGLWDRVQREYAVDDPAGIEFLCLACEALDRAQALSEAIQRDGDIIRTRDGIKTHPAVKEELANRAFVTRTLQRLGLNYEPLRASPGRPPSTRSP